MSSGDKNSKIGIGNIGHYIPASADEKPQEGEVIAVGNGERDDRDEVNALDVKVGDRILFGKCSGSDIKLNGNEYLIMREDEILGVLNRPSIKATGVTTENLPVTSQLMSRAIETFGSEQAAREWLSLECGDLDNRTPAAFIKITGNEGEVERILGCIDYGMIA